MKIPFTALIFLFAALSPAFTQEAPPIKYIERACSLISAADSEEDMQAWSEDQKEIVVTAVTWIGGFIRGVNLGLLIPDDFEYLTPPDKWTSHQGYAPSILAFIQEHRSELNLNADSTHLIEAWYLSEHPNATKLTRSMSNKLLALVSANSE